MRGEGFVAGEENNTVDISKKKKKKKQEQKQKKQHSLKRGWASQVVG